MVWTHTVNVGQDKAWIKNLIRYATNELKTENGRFCEFHNCTPDNVDVYFEMLLNQKNYIANKEYKGGVFHTIISHEVVNDDIDDAECELLYKNKDIDAYKDWLTKQGKNPEDYAFFYAGHRDTNRQGDTGQYHGHIVALVVNINDLSAPLIRDDKANRYLLQDVAMEHFPNETTITRNYKKEMEYRKEHPKEKFKNTELVFNKSATPTAHILTSQSAKRRWEYIISNANMSPTQRKRELLKTDIDDAIETVKENYKEGKSNYCDYKSFLKEMNKRGYSYRQNKANSKSDWLKFTNKNWPQYVKNGKPETVYYQFKDLGYTKADINKRINNELDFTPPDPSVYQWNDIDSMPKNKRLRKQAEYINYCNVRKACRTAKFIGYLFGGNIIGLIAAILLAFLLKATLPKVKQIYKEINLEDYNRHMAKVNVVKNNEPKTEVVVDDDRFINILNKALNKQEKQVSTAQISQPVLIQTNSASKNASETPLELKNKTTTNVDSSQSIVNNSSDAGFASEPPSETPIEKADAGLASAVEIADDDAEYKALEKLLDKSEEYFKNRIFGFEDLVAERDSYAKNTAMRKDFNKKVVDEYLNLGKEFPEFKSYVENDLKLEFKPKNILNNYVDWFNNFATDEALLKPYQKANKFSASRALAGVSSEPKKDEEKKEIIIKKPKPNGSEEH